MVELYLLHSISLQNSIDVLIVRILLYPYSLTTDTSTMVAIGNDCGFAFIFPMQLWREMFDVAIL